MSTSLTFEQTDLPGVLLIQPAVFGDSRGFFLETYHYEKYATHGLDVRFVQDNWSHSARNVLRGLHYQLRKPQGKLVSAMQGEIYDVAVDIRLGSPTFGKWYGVVLSAQNKKQLFIPAGFAHGFSVLSEEADVVYKCTDLFDASDDRGVIWSDSDLKISWQINSPELSAKDSRLPALRDIPEEFLPRF